MVTAPGGIHSKNTRAQQSLCAIRMHSMTLATSSENREALLARYHEVRSRTQLLCAPLQVEDFGVQDKTKGERE